MTGFRRAEVLRDWDGRLSRRPLREVLLPDDACDRELFLARENANPW